MKKTAFAVWMNRIAPVMDVACTVCVVEGESLSEGTHFSLPGDHPSAKALFLRELGVDTLVCGALSRNMLHLLNAQGIGVVPFIAGDLETVIGAWFGKGLPDGALAMPGCGGGGRFGHGCGGNRRTMGGAESPCVCTACGHSEPRVRGVPCVRRQCPNCGAAMKRN